MDTFDGVPEAEKILSESADEIAEKILLETRPVAAQTIAELVMFSDSDSIRLNASKYVMDYFKTTSKKPDEWDQLFRDLEKNAPK